ncbi:MAG: PEGA domain-containing protein [Polyangiaceae bacterium]
MRAVGSLAVAAVVAMATPRVALAQPTEEAKQLFAEGNERYLRGDYLGAADAYRRAYGLARYRVILFNLGRAYEHLGRPVEAVDAYRRVLAAPGKLEPAHEEAARQSLVEQQKLVAELSISCNVDGATIRVDGEEVGAVPLAAPVKVASGRVVVEATREGFVAGYHAVEAPGGTVVPVVVELVEAAARLAQIRVLSDLPAAEVWIDGRLVAITPLRSTLSVTPDEAHRVELRRPGYRTAVETLTLGAGTTTEIELTPEIRRDALPSEGGTLALTLVQEDASILVDGVRRELGADGVLRLPAGRHELTAERSGYDALRLEVEVPVRDRVTVTVDLIPTPETRASLIDEAEMDRGLGWGLTLGGGALLGAGTGLLVWSLGQRAQASDDFDDLKAHPDLVNKDAYDQRLFDLGARKDAMTGLAVGSSIGAAVGLAGVVTGVVFIATGEDPEQYRLTVDDGVFAVEPVISPVGGFFGLRGRF